METNQMSQNYGAANILGCHPSLAEIISSLATYLLKKGKVSFFFDIGFILEILSAISYSVL